MRTSRVGVRAGRALVACAVVALAACSAGGGGGGNSGNGGSVGAAPSPTVIIVAPTTTVYKGQSARFSATVVDAGPGVAWTVEGGATYGTITAEGLYTAPSTVPDGPAIIRATSTADPRGASTASIRVAVGDQLERRSNAPLPAGAVGATAGTLSGGQRGVAVSGSIVYVVWSENQSGLERVYASVSRDRGQTFGAPSQLSPMTTTFPHRYPSVSVDAMGRAVVAWVGSSDGALWDVYARGMTVDASGALLLGPRQIVASMGTVGDPLVALAMTPQGTVCFAWVAQGPSDTEILLAIGSPAGDGALTISPPVQASGAFAARPMRPAVAVNEVGSMVVAWSDSRDDPSEGTADVWWRRARIVDNTVEVVAPETRVNRVITGAQVLASVVVDPSGMAAVAWSDGRTNERRQLYFASSSADNLLVTADALIVDETGLGSQQNFPSVALGADGEVTIAFADNRTCIEMSGSPSTCPLGDDGTGQTDIYIVRRLAGETVFNPVPNLRVNDDEAPGVQQHGRPSVAVDDAGRAVVFWTDDRDGISKPFMARVE